MKSYAPDTPILYKPKRGKVRKGVAKPGFVDTGKVKVLLEGDPFPVDVPRKQVSACDTNGKVVSSRRKVPKVGASKSNRKDQSAMTTTKPNAKSLRKEAMALGIEWEDLGLKELADAVAKAKAKTTKGKKSKGKKVKASKPKASSAKQKKTSPAPAKKATKKATNGTAKAKAKSEPAAGSDEALGLTFAKATPPKDLPAEGVNPFRPNSNLHVVAKLLLKGGQRQKLAEQLSQKVSLHPYQKASDAVDLNDYDKRLILGSQTMRDQFGFGIQRTGRGLEGKILVFRPGGEKDPRKTAKGKGRK